MKSISTIIGTCDSYSHLWNNFHILFKKYWKLNTANYVVGETLSFPYEGYKNILPGQGDWGARMLACLDQVQTPYVFFILEDYYLTEQIDEATLQEHVALLEKYNADKIMLDVIEHGEYNLQLLEDGLYIFDLSSNYLNSIQPSIWKTDYLKMVLKSYYNPWQFELEGNIFTSSISPKILIKARQQPIYFNYARVGGKISNGWESIFKKENLI
jgi:hypothetical protein